MSDAGSNRSPRSGAAWKAGRCWNRLRHAVEAANVTGPGSGIAAVAEAAQTLSIAVRGLVEGVREQDRLSEAVTRLADTVHADLASERYLEASLHANEDLSDSDDDHHDVLQQLSKRDERDLRLLQAQLEQGLDETELRLFRLAIAVDGGLRSQNVLQDLATVEPELDAEIFVEPLEGWVSRSGLLPTRKRNWHLPSRLKSDWGTRPVRAVWRQLIEARWREAGLPTEALPRGDPHSPQGQASQHVRSWRQSTGLPRVCWNSNWNRSDQRVRQMSRITRAPRLISKSRQTRPPRYLVTSICNWIKTVAPFAVLASTS